MRCFKARLLSSWKVGKTTSPVKETKQQSQPMGNSYSNLVNMRRKFQPCVSVTHKITGGIDQRDWLLEKLSYTELEKRLPAITKIKMEMLKIN
jgi:hypothetical protein